MVASKRDRIKQAVARLEAAATRHAIEWARTQAAHNFLPFSVPGDNLAACQAQAFVLRLVWGL